MELIQSSISESDYEFTISGLSAMLINKSYQLLSDRHGYKYDLLQYDVGIRTDPSNDEYWRVLFMPKNYIDGNPDPGEEWMYITYLDVPEQTFIYDKATLNLVEMYGGR